jgi:hypothetical protein
MQNRLAKKKVSRRKKTYRINMKKIRESEKIIDDLKNMIAETKRRVALSHARIIDNIK